MRYGSPFFLFCSGFRPLSMFIIKFLSILESISSFVDFFLCFFPLLVSWLDKSGVFPCTTYGDIKVSSLSLPLQVLNTTFLSLLFLGNSIKLTALPFFSASYTERYVSFDSVEMVAAKGSRSFAIEDFGTSTTPFCLRGVIG